MSNHREEFREQKAQLIAYLLSKVKAGDFHAVQDAASDIRELDAKLAILAEVQPSGPIPYPREDYIPRDQGRTRLPMPDVLTLGDGEDATKAARYAQRILDEPWTDVQRKQNAEQHAGPM